MSLLISWGSSNCLSGWYSSSTLFSAFFCWLELYFTQNNFTKLHCFRLFIESGKRFLPVAANHADFYQTTENNVFTSSSLSYAIFSSFSESFLRCFWLYRTEKRNFCLFFYQSRLVYLIFLKPMFLLSSCYITLLSASYHQKHVSDAAPKTAFLPFCT